MDHLNEEQKEIMLEYVYESMDALDSVDPSLIHIEHSTNRKQISDTIHLIFRAFHSLKGGAGFLNLDLIQKVAHSTENLLQTFRANPDKWNPKYINLLLKSSDLIRRIFQQVQECFNDLGFESEAIDLVDELEQSQITIRESEVLPWSPDEVEVQLSEKLEEPELPVQEVLKRSAGLINLFLGHSWKTIDKEWFFRESKSLLTEISRHCLQLDGAPNEGGEEAMIPFDSDSTKQDSLKGIEDPEEVALLKKEYLETLPKELENVEGVFLVLDKIPGDIDTNEFLQSALDGFQKIKNGVETFKFQIPLPLLEKTMVLLQAVKAGKHRLESTETRFFFSLIAALKESVPMLEKEELFEVELFDNVTIVLNEILGEDKEDQEVAKTQNGDNASDSKRGDSKSSAENKAVNKEPIIPVMPKEGGLSQNQDIRVSLNKLDQLIDLVGELIISETMISQHPGLNLVDMTGLKDAAAQLHRNMRDLQEIAMSMRMVPLASLFRKMIRVVHDSSKKLDKKVELILEGEKTEVDKTLVELVTDPLLHIVRNAVDHGIEIPEVRKESGKSPGGSIRLSAKHVGNEVWIVIQDDGAGLNRDKILQNAIKKGLIEKDHSLSDQEIWNLIFEPGFSTTEVVTQFSGRGVGMDVVNKNIEKLHGRVDVDSTVGGGTTITLRIPLTLSIIDGLLVEVGDTSYTLPTTTVSETLQPIRKNIIKMMDGSEMLRIRQKLLPIIRLHKLYDLPANTTELTDGMLLVVEHNEQRFCLFVDGISGQQQVVVKGLPESMADSPHLSGCTILGDGQVGLILDAASLARVLKSC